MSIQFVLLLLLVATISFSSANVIYQQSSIQVSSPSKDSPVEKEIKHEYGNKDCTIEMDRMSARLLRLEQGIYENNQEKDIDLTKKRANFKENEINLIYSQLKSRLEDLESKVDLYVSKKIEVATSYLVEFETRIMERVSNRLLSMDSKFVEQTKQISEIFGLLDKKHADNKLDEVNKVTSMTPSPTLTTSTASVSVSTLETTTATSETNKKAPENKNNCTYSTKRNEVKCKNVPIKDIIELFFKKTDIVTDQHLLRSIDLTIILQRDELIPAHILGNKKTEKLVIEYHKDPSVPLLKVDVNAFQSTKNYTKTLKLSKLDCSRLDLGFLSGFNQLTDLEFYKVDHIQKCLSTLPLLPKLTGLRLEIVRGLDDSITIPTLSTGGLKTFEFMYYDGKQNDALVSRMLDWILPSSAKSLESLILVDIKITKIPSQIISFKALTRLHLSSNWITTIKTGELSFSVPVSEVGLSGNQINSIEPGAFQGNFTDADIDLKDNILTRFEESVFRPTLEQMVSGGGQIQFNDNRIDCSTENICHLAWVIRDEGLRAKAMGGCSNGSTFDVCA